MATSGKPAGGRIDAPRMWSQSYRLVSSVIAGVTPSLAELGLEPKELFTLAAIDEHPHPAEVADTLCMPKPTVTVYLKRLESEAWVQREIDPGDLRRHCLTVTPAGRKVLARGLSLLSEAFGERLSQLSTQEQAQLAALLDKLS